MKRKTGQYEVIHTWGKTGIQEREIYKYSSDYNRWNGHIPNEQMESNPSLVIDEQEVFDRLNEAEEMRKLLKELSEISNHIDLNECENGHVIYGLIDKAKQFTNQQFLE